MHRWSSSLRCAGLRRGCGRRADPDGDQHDDSLPPAELEQRVGRVRARDQHVDHRVIDPGHTGPLVGRPRDPVIHGADPEHRARAGGEERCRDAGEGGRRTHDEQQPERQGHEERVVVHDAAEPRFDARRRLEISRSRGEPPSSPRLRLLARTMKSCPNATHRPPSWLLSRVAAPLPRGWPREQSLRPEPHPKIPLLASVTADRSLRSALASPTRLAGGGWCAGPGASGPAVRSRRLGRKAAAGRVYQRGRRRSCGRTTPLDSRTTPIRRPVPAAATR